jgi:hypothetical protein
VSTIPASDIAQIIPGVLPAGGSSFSLIGLMLSSSSRVPINGTDNPVILAFANALAVSSYFGPNSIEYELASTYFLGFTNSQALPGSLLIAQYNSTRVSAFLRGGNASAQLAALQAITSGALEVIVDGFSWKSTSINLSSDNTFSAIAATVQSDLALPSSASGTGSIAPNVNPGSSNNMGVMTITGGVTGTIAVGQVVAGSGVSAGTYITGYGTGTGGDGTYYVSISQTVNSEALTFTASAASFTASIAGNTMTVSAVGSGTLQPGMVVTGAGVTAVTTIKSQQSGTIGGDGAYTIYPSQTVSSEAMTGAPGAIAVTYDSIAEAFVITSGTNGTVSTVSFGTRSLATTMLLTQATGAVLSQGAAPADPVGFMTNVQQQTQNWETLFMTFDPDLILGNPSEPPTQKLLFAQWTNSTDDAFTYACWDQDILPTEGLATGSFGYLNGINGANNSGIVPISTSDPNKAAFVAGTIASVNFSQTDGRTVLKFRQQTGLVADVTSQTVANNLRSNGYNFYGAWATRANNFIGFADGVISGPFNWVDSYIDQAWLDDALQVALMTMFFNIRSIPFNQPGASIVRTACLGPINAALNFGAIVPGVDLTPLQIQTINNAAGNQQAGAIVANTGWYLQAAITTASAAQRTARAATGTLWYADGGSVQEISLNVVDVQ